VPAFAPVYRQLTLRAIGGQITAAAAQRAYTDVCSAWLDYLRNHNKGRGVLLIGHSQGTYILRQRIKAEIEPSRKVRRRLVSALFWAATCWWRGVATREATFAVSAPVAPLARRAA
jgi:phosphohistidine phosphatase SixA